MNHRRTTMSFMLSALSSTVSRLWSTRVLIPVTCWFPQNTMKIATFVVLLGGGFLLALLLAMSCGCPEGSSDPDSRVVSRPRTIPPPPAPVGTLSHEEVLQEMDDLLWETARTTRRFRTARMSIPTAREQFRRRRLISLRNANRRLRREARGRTPPRFLRRRLEDDRAEFDSDGEFRDEEISMDERESPERSESSEEEEEAEEEREEEGTAGSISFTTTTTALPPVSSVGSGQQPVATVTMTTTVAPVGTMTTTMMTMATMTKVPSATPTATTEPPRMVMMPTEEPSLMAEALATGMPLMATTTTTTRVPLETKTTAVEPPRTTLLPTEKPSLVTAAPATEVPLMATTTTTREPPPMSTTKMVRPGQAVVSHRRATRTTTSPTTAVPARPLRKTALLSRSSPTTPPALLPTRARSIALPILPVGALRRSPRRAMSAAELLERRETRGGRLERRPSSIAGEPSKAPLSSPPRHPFKSPAPSPSSATAVSRQWRMRQLSAPFSPLTRGGGGTATSGSLSQSLRSSRRLPARLQGTPEGSRSSDDEVVVGDDQCRVVSRLSCPLAWSPAESEPAAPHEAGDSPPATASPRPAPLVLGLAPPAPTQIEGLLPCKEPTPEQEEEGEGIPPLLSWPENRIRYQRRREFRRFVGNISTDMLSPVSSPSLSLDSDPPSDQAESESLSPLARAAPHLLHPSELRRLMLTTRGRRESLAYPTETERISWNLALTDFCVGETDRHFLRRQPDPIQDDEMARRYEAAMLWTRGLLLSGHTPLACLSSGAYVGAFCQLQRLLSESPIIAGSSLVIVLGFVEQLRVLVPGCFSGTASSW